jgi:hypothetical protein
VDNVNLGATYGLSASFLQASVLSSDSEKLITTGPTAGGMLYADLQVDSQFIEDTTLISGLLNESNWDLGVYGSVSTGAVEGQIYVGPK